MLVLHILCLSSSKQFKYIYLHVLDSCIVSPLAWSRSLSVGSFLALSRDDTEYSLTRWCCGEIWFITLTFGLGFGFQLLPVELLHLACLVLLFSYPALLSLELPLPASWLSSPAVLMSSAQSANVDPKPGWESVLILTPCLAAVSSSFNTGMIFSFC